MSALSVREVDLVNGARRAVLATITSDGAPRLVPITFVYRDGVLYTALDEKPKAVADPRDLARVHDIQADPRVSVLVDAWSEDWTELGWVRLSGSARLISSDDQPGVEHADVIRLLRAKYTQYAAHALEQRPLIRISIERVRSWFAT